MSSIVHDPSQWKPPSKPRATQVKLKVLTIEVLWPDDPPKQAETDRFLLPLKEYCGQDRVSFHPGKGRVGVTEAIKDAWR